VFAKLGAAVNRHPVTKEVGDWFAGAAFTLLALAGISSLAWFSRLPKRPPSSRRGRLLLATRWHPFALQQTTPN
jgi:hypothetical protein